MSPSRRTLSDVRLVTKLVVTSLLITAMAAVLAATGIYSAAQLSRGQQTLYERNVSAAVELGRVRASFNSSAKDNTDMLITQEPEVKTAEVRDKNRAGHDAEVDAAWAAYEASHPASSSAQRSAFETNLAVYRQARVDDLDPEAIAGDNAAWVAAYRASPALQAFADINTALDEMQQAEADAAQQAAAQGRSTYRTAVLTVLVTAGVGLAVVLGFFVLLGR